MKTIKLLLLLAVSLSSTRIWAQINPCPSYVYMSQCVLTNGGSCSKYITYPMSTGGYTAHYSRVSCCGTYVWSVDSFGPPICEYSSLRDPQIQKGLAVIAQDEPVYIVDCQGYIRRYQAGEVARLD